MTDFKMMEAGPELDALVAERVMGWRVDRTYCPPTFSTDIATAWEVWQVSVDRWPYVFARALMRELKVSDKRLLCDGIADVLIRLTPLAICRAALKAVEKGG